MAPPSFDIPHRGSAVSKLTLKLFLFIVRLSVAPIPLPPPPPPCLLSRQPVTASTLPLETTMDTRADFDAMLPASRCPVLRNFLVLPLPLPPPVLLSFCCALLSLCACSSVGRSVTACSLLLSRFLLCDVLSSLGYGCTGLAVALELLRGWSSSVGTLRLCWYLPAPLCGPALSTFKLADWRRTRAVVLEGGMSTFVRTWPDEMRLHA